MLQIETVTGISSANSTYSQCFSPDGEHLILGGAWSNKMNLFKKDASDPLKFNKLTRPSYPPVHNSSGALVGSGFLSDGSELFLLDGQGSSISSQALYRVQRNGDDYNTLLSMPSVGNVDCCALAVCDSYVAVAARTGTTFTLYKRVPSESDVTGFTYEKLTGLPSTPTLAAGDEMAISPDGKYLVFGFSTAPYLKIYKIDNDVLTALSTPAYAPDSGVVTVQFSPDSKFLAFGQDGGTSTKRLTVYEIGAGDTFTALGPVTVSADPVRQVMFADTGRLFVAVGEETSAADNLLIYTVGPASFTPYDSGSLNKGEFFYGSAITKDGVYASFGLSVSPFVETYRINPPPEGEIVLTFPKFTNAIEADITGSYKVNGASAFPSMGTGGIVVIDDPSQQDGYIYPSIDVQPTYVGIFPDSTATVTAKEADYPYVYSFGIFPAFVSTVETLITDKIDAAFTFPTLQTDGMFEWPLKLTADQTFAKFGSAFELSMDELGGYGNPMYPAFISQGSVDVPTGTIGAVTFSPFTSEGSVDVPIVVEGGALFASLSSAGVINNPIEGQGAAAFRPFRMTSEFEVVIPEVYEVTMESILPAFQTSGEGTVPLMITGDSAFPRFSTAGEITVPFLATAPMTLPGFETDALFYHPYRIDSNAKFPAMTSESLGGRVTYINGDILFPVFASEAEVDLLYKATVAATFPGFTSRARDQKIVGRARSSQIGIGILSIQL